MFEMLYNSEWTLIRLVLLFHLALYTEGPGQMVRVNPDICPWRENIAVKRLKHDQCGQLNLACKILYNVTSLWSPIHYNLKCILWLIQRHYIHIKYTIYILHHVVSAMLANISYLTLGFQIIWSWFGTLPTLSTAALQHKDEVRMSN